MLNWGTFDKKVWTVKLNGKTSLLTGDIGTGKSTLVDAITTLLVPSHRVAYNRAAGAASRERTLKSYVLGHYKAERGEFADSSARPVALRDSHSYSVILGVFKNVGYMQTVTLAQVFWNPDRVGQPERFFAAAERDMSITADFSRFGAEITRLRKMLRQDQVEVWNTFPPYGAWFRRRFGIHNEQALELFHQTVSMKSVGNLTDFVRNHILEPFGAAGRIKFLISHYDDLNRAHLAVLRAKAQIGSLTPLIEGCDRHTALAEDIEEQSQCRDALSPYFAGIKIGLLDERIAKIEGERTRQEASIQRCEDLRVKLEGRIDGLRRDRSARGGDRLDQLESDIKRGNQERERRTGKAKQYAKLLGDFDETLPDSSDAFTSQRQRLAGFREDLRADRERWQNELTELSVTRRQREAEHTLLADEIISLKARRTNIPSAQIAMRQRLCRALKLHEDTLPFVGELLSVREEHSAWEGAAERLLRNFGLSLLVSDSQYSKVAAWVDQTDLRGRLVYFRARERRSKLPELHRDSIVRKVSIKPDSAFYDWLTRELARRFDVACCDTQEQFRLEPRAISMAGQIKHSGERHEKDDRHRIDDRARYVLGWDNVAKIRTFEQKKQLVETKLEDSDRQIRNRQSELARVNNRLDTLSKLEPISDFREIDRRSIASELADLNRERKHLESASDVIGELTKRLEKALQESETTRIRRNRMGEQLGEFNTKLNQARTARTETQLILDEADLTVASKKFEKLAKLLSEVLRDRKLSVESCDKHHKDLDIRLDARIKAKGKELLALRDNILRTMASFKGEFPLETAEFDASIEAEFEYRKMLADLENDALPSFEKRFKQLLNENTIREVANFQSLLDRERETIRERVERINEALSKIEYNKDRYISLEYRYAPDQEIREFRKQLEKCTEGTLSGSDDAQYSERKFLEVKKVIERFRGRDDMAELDRRWTQKVTDVRNWFVFGASERRCDDHSEFEHYHDSAGKSGGQKEKLAYTILSASLAYQFGLEWGPVRSRSFRFVVIDEAFGRGSDESAEFALTLFSKMHLQLLVVTPLQKTHVIEPFVESVALVDIEDDRNSRLMNLTITEYKEMQRAKDARLPRQAVEVLGLPVDDPVPAEAAEPR